MNMQTKASFHKEYLAFTKTHRLLILALIIIGWAILGPIMIRGLGIVMNTLAPVYDELGLDISEMTDMLALNVSTGVTSAISDLTTTGLIAALILINSFAGGEQKKRSIMIPKSAGLRNHPYLLPKYIIYPLTVLILATIAAFVSWGISTIVFEINDVSGLNVLLGGLLAGISLMFYISIHLTLGTATGKAGMSSVIVIIISLLLPNLFAALGSELIYNPFTLNIMATSLIIDNIALMPLFQPQEIIVTVIITLVLIAILYFIALFVQNAKKIDNSGNEIRL